MRKQISIAWAILVLGVAFTAFAQQGAQSAASLIFREDFKTGAVGSQVQLTQDAIVDPNVELKTYGPGGRPGVGRDSGLLLGQEEDPPNPGKLMSIVYTGVAQGSWAVMLRDRNNYLDLRETGRLRWRVRQ